jgi:5-methylcytosine-specific restriction enzyme A
MTRSLLRPCLGCGKQVRGKSRCRDCQRTQDQAKYAKRPDARTHAEQERRRRLVADHRATIGDWCPGLANHPAHPSADLVADHVVEIAAGGLASGPLRVLCRSENSRRSAWLATGLGPLVAAQPATPRPPNFPTLFESTDPGDREGPVVA